MSEIIPGIPQAVAEFEQRRLNVINQLKELGSRADTKLQVRQHELPTQVQQLAAILNPNSNPIVDAVYYPATGGRTSSDLGIFGFIWEKEWKRDGISGFSIRPRLNLLLNNPGFLELGGRHAQGCGMSTSTEKGRYSPDIYSQRYDLFAKAAYPAYTSYHLDLLKEVGTFFLERSMPLAPQIPTETIGARISTT